MLVLGSLALPAVAGAITQVIPGDTSAQNQRRMTIYIGDRGALQAANATPCVGGGSVPGMFFGSACGPASNFWHLRLKGAPAPNMTITSSETTKVNPVSNGPVTGNWTPASPAQNVTVYRVEDPNSETNLFEIRQTVLYVGFDLRFRVVWEIRNIDPQRRTLPFIFGTSADLFIDSDDSGAGVFIDGPNRFVGGTNAARRTSGGLQEVTSSALPGQVPPTPIPRWASYQESRFFAATRRLEDFDAFTNTIDPNVVDNGVGASFDNRAVQGLAPDQTQRYEVIWVLKRQTPLSVNPPVAAKELPASHTVTFSLVDVNFNPVPGVGVCVGVTGANPRPVSRLVTDASGLVSLTYTGANAGLDTINGRVDGVNTGGCAQPSSTDPRATATVSWVADNHVAGPPQVPGNFNGPNGNPIPITTQPNPGNPDAPTIQIGRGASANAGGQSCTYDRRTGLMLNLPVTAQLQPGAGTISNVRGFLTNPSRHDPPAGVLPEALADPTASGNSYTFNIECVVDGELWVEFTLTEGANSQVFRIPIGGLQLIDPQGVVHDQALYAQAVAAGQTPAQARASSALSGATVTLQRAVGGAFINVLSGDPGISPNVNPQVTSASGLYQWDVQQGSYRVSVTRPGCQPVTSATVDIPPPVLDLHIPLDCGTVVPPVVTPPVVPPAVTPQAVTPQAVTPPAVAPPAVAPPAVTPPAVTPPAVTPPAVTPPAVTVDRCRALRGNQRVACQRARTLRKALARCARLPVARRALCRAQARRAAAIVRCGDLRRGVRKAACLATARRNFALARCATLPRSRRPACLAAARQIRVPSIRVPGRRG